MNQTIHFVRKKSNSYNKFIKINQKTLTMRFDLNNYNEIQKF